MTVQKKAIVISTITAFVLTSIKFIIALITGSAVVLASAVDSILDMLISIFNFFAIKTSEKETNKKFNYGFGKIEGFASIIEGILIILSAIFIIYKGYINIRYNKEILNIDLAFYVMIFSTLVTYFLVVFLEKSAKLTNSLVIKSDALHYKTDLYTNIGILISVAIIYFSELFIIDGIISIVIAIYIIYQAAGVIKDGIYMLMDRALDKEVQDLIVDILRNSPISGFHFLRSRRSGEINFVDVHLVFREDILLKEAHHISDEIEEKIRLLDEKSKWLITTHLDPHDDSKQEKEIQ